VNDFLPVVGVYFHFNRAAQEEQAQRLRSQRNSRLSKMEQAQLWGYYTYQATVCAGGAYAGLATLYHAF